MYLALLGFGMIVVFMALIMAKKLSPFTSLILIPIVFGLLAGYGWDTLEYAANGIINVASTFAMMTFAILYFGVMLTAGMFDPMVDAVVSWCKGDPLKVLVGTSVLAAFVSLDGDGTTTVMICCTAMLPIYERLRIKKIYLATLIILQNCIMNLIPWGGPTARVMSVMNLDAGEILAPLVPGMILGALYSVGVGYYLGLKERKRLGVTKNVEIEVAKVELSAEERAWKRPKMIFVNLILTAAIIVALVMGLASSEILFGVGTAIALLVNFGAADSSSPLVYISLFMIAMGIGGSANFTTSLPTSIFGRQGFDKVNSVIFPIQGAITALCFLVNGVVQKMTGGQIKMAYLVFAGVALVNVVLVLIVNEHRFNRDWKAAHPGK